MPRARIQFVASDFLDLSVTFAINGARWEYFLSHAALSNVIFLARNVSAGKALAYAKAKAVRANRLERTA